MANAPSFDLTFGVKAQTAHGEKLCVVGNCPQLGNWKPQNAQVLSLESKEKNGVEFWSKTIRVPMSPEIQYRFFICHIRETEHEEESSSIMVRQFESHIKPRTFSLQAYSQNPDEHNAKDGIFGEIAGQYSVDRGWLTGQTEIHFRIHTNPIHMWKHSYRQHKFRIKCTPLDLQYKDSSDEEDLETAIGRKLSMDEDSSQDMPTNSSTNRVQVTVLDKDNAIPTDQKQFGTLYQDGDYMVFRSQFFEIESMGYQFDFYIHDPCAGPNDPHKFIGHALILPSNLKDNIGVKTVPITSQKHKPIGQLTVNYLIIKPLQSYDCEMSVTYATHWKERRTLDVGHRGMGSSYGHASTSSTEESPIKCTEHVQKCEVVRENTIASLSEAGAHGADYVEFDVQLSKDNIPIIYHDFMVSLTLRKKHSEELDWFDIPVHDLSLHQLQMLKLDHVSEKQKGSPDASFGSMHSQDDPVNSHVFPTLKECFEHLDPNIGFNVEIKYCMQLQSGELESDLSHYKERNEYLDPILTEILQYAGSRKVVISCFDPDICTMVRLKQNRIPVLLLTQGNSVKYPPFMDPRANCTIRSACHCKSEQFLGVNPHTEDLLRQPELISLVKSLGLVMFCWGDDNNSKANIKMLREKGVDGIIYDRIHEFKPSSSEHQLFSLDKESKIGLLKDIGALGTSREVTPTPEGSPTQQVPTQ